LARWSDSIRERWSLPGWRDERSVVWYGERPLFGIERALLRPLGLALRSVQACAWRQTADGPMIWVAHRSMSKPIDPGKFDALVAGGIAGLDAPWETLIRECQEEAGIPPPLLSKARPAGHLELSYATDYDDLPALHREHVTLYELELPAEFIPTPNDGEHQAILSMTPQEAIASIAQGGWTPDGAQATTDLIGRQGWLKGISLAGRDQVSGP
jgi:8-oxo-dGTP pyrophosphatase MutT (NUDIX family)